MNTTINPFLQQILGALVRTAIVWAATKFGAEISNDDAVKLAAQITPVIAVVAWSVGQKYHGRQKLLTALASPVVMTEHEVEAKVSDAQSPTPSVLTPKSEVPA